MSAFVRMCVKGEGRRESGLMSGGASNSKQIGTGILDDSYKLVRKRFNGYPHCNKGRGMCYPVCGMVHIKKEPLLLIGKSSLCGCSGFTLSLSEWSFTICPTP